MKYSSTRGHVKGLSFSDAVMMGLGDDGGLLLPESLPQISAAQQDHMRDMSYPQLAYEIISHFATDIPENDLRTLIEHSYATFDDPKIAPVVKQGDLYILELFHGPTLAFKDIALQFLGNLFEYFLAQRRSHMNIIGATSGDTGSAAIYGVRNKRNINIFILHPAGRVSPIQELQMTTVTAPNVFNLAVEGTFDDAQAIVKEIFGDLPFKEKHALGAVNSINWARVLAQIVYYFYAAYRIQKDSGMLVECDISVPTGNFGDIFAGYIAARMGAPINQLILATNSNNILSRFINDGDYSISSVRHSLSPSMDIQVASNFERYLFDLYNRDAERLVQAMDEFRHSGRLCITGEELRRVREDFLAGSIDDRQTLETIRDFHQQTGYILDPHTAVGVAVGRARRSSHPLLCLATAHPAKFPEAVEQAIGTPPPVPSALSNLDRQERRVQKIAADCAQVKAFIADNAI